MAYMPPELASRVYNTLADKTLPPPVFNTLLALSELCDPHGGPIPLAEIQRYSRAVMRVELSDRTVKGAVKQLIEQYGVAIGSARGAARHGYFFIRTDEEATAAAAPLLAEIRSLATRCRTLSPKNPYIQHLLGQMEVQL
jgi:hypothetical protein